MSHVIQVLKFVLVKFCS